VCVNGLSFGGVSKVPSPKFQFHIVRIPELAAEAFENVTSFVSHAGVDVAKDAVGKELIITCLVAVSEIHPLSVLI